MKKITTLLLLSIFVYSCGVKQTQSMLSDGDYDGAINRAAEGLKTNKNAKGKQKPFQKNNNQNKPGA